MTRILFILLALVAYISAENSGNVRVPRLVDTRIVGGYPVSIVKHPYQVSLRLKAKWLPDKPYSHICGGSIQSERIIITAAHCVEGYKSNDLQIIAGTNNRRGNDGFIAPVQEIIMHEHYNPYSVDNDIAIIGLSVPLPLNNFTTRAIELAEHDPRNGAMATVTGWGKTKENGDSADELQEIHVSIISNDICKKDYPSYIKDSMICAGVREGGKGTCQQDSGGPLVVNGKLTGVVSWGYGCARPYYPGVYAKVSYLHPWLMENINKIKSQLTQ